MLRNTKLYLRYAEGFGEASESTKKEKSCDDPHFVYS